MASGAVGREQPLRDEGPHGEDEANGITTAIGDSLCTANPLFVRGRNLGQPIDPFGVDPSRRAGVDDLGLRVF